MTSYAEIVRDPHFNNLAAVIRVPFWSYGWRRRHPEVPFHLLLNAVNRVISSEFMASRGAGPFLEAFADLVWRITAADPRRLHYTEDDMTWLVEQVSGAHAADAAVVANLLMAAASAADRFVTPAEVAEATGTAESGWRNKAAAGDIPGVIKKGKQWLLPVSILRSRGIALPDRTGEHMDTLLDADTSDDEDAGGDAD